MAKKKANEGLDEKRVQRFIDLYTEKRTYGVKGKHMHLALKVNHQLFEFGRGDVPFNTGDKEDEEHIAFMRRMLAIALISLIQNEEKLEQDAFMDLVKKGVVLLPEYPGKKKGKKKHEGPGAGLPGSHGGDLVPGDVGLRDPAGSGAEGEEMIAECSECVRRKQPHYQDTQHGMGRRVFGVALEKGSGYVRRCTVCATETDFAAPSQTETRGSGKLKKPSQKGKKPTGKNPSKKSDR